MPFTRPTLATVRPRRLGWSPVLLSLAIAIALVILATGSVVIVASQRRPPQTAEQPAPPQPTEATAAPAEPSTTAETPAAVQQVVPDSGSDHGAARLWGLTGGAPAGATEVPLGGQGRLPNALARARDQYPTLLGPRPPRVIPTIPSSALGFAWPLDGYVTSTFSDAHPLGIDIAPREFPGLVLAARDGRVVLAGGDRCCGYGYYVILDHGDGLTSIYGHFRDPPLVHTGEQVQRGTVLGIAGETGHAIGVHLHFEVRVGGLPVDPEAVLTAGRINPVPAYTGQPPVDDADERGLSPAEADPAPPASTDADLPAPTPAPDAALTPAASPEPGSAAAITSPTPSPRATAVPTPSPTPAATPVASPIPTPTPTSIMTTSPTPTPTPAPMPTPTPTPAPCASVRLRAGEREAQPSSVGMPVLQLETGALQSASIERCGADPLAVTARPLDGQRCSAALYDRDGRRLRALVPLASSAEPDPQTTTATHWRIDPADLTPGTVLGLSCVPVSTGETG